MSNSTCYWPPNFTNSDLPPPRYFIPCGNTGSGQTCCIAGDVCLSDSICYYTHFQENGSGYYIGGCTDWTFSDSACSKHCSKSSLGWPHMSSTSGLWACCATPFAKDCTNPSDRTFQAAPLDQLKRVTSSLESSIRCSSVPSTSTLTLLVSASSPLNSAAAMDTASCSTQPPSSTSKPDGRGPNLGSGAKVGIATGAIIVGLLILACIVYWVRRSKAGQPILDGPDQSDLDPSPSPRVAELDARQSSSRTMVH